MPSQFSEARKFISELLHLLQEEVNIYGDHQNRNPQARLHDMKNIHIQIKSNSPKKDYEKRRRPKTQQTENPASPLRDTESGKIKKCDQIKIKLFSDSKAFRRKIEFIKLMLSRSTELIQTPGISNGIQSENSMKQIVYAQFYDFLETLNQDLKKLNPVYEEDPEQFNSDLTADCINSILRTFDSSLDLFTNILNMNSFLTSSRQEPSIISTVFSSVFTNYMQMTSDLLSHDFPNNSILPFVGVYSNLSKVYIDILRAAQIGTNKSDGNNNVDTSLLKSVWNRHYSIFTGLPNLIKSFDFLSISQKIENAYQYIKNFSQDDNSQLLSVNLNNLSYLLKSMKEKINKIDEKTTKIEIQNLLNETSSFQEYIQTIGQSQLSGFNMHMPAIYLLITYLELTNSTLNVSEYLERLNKIVSQDNFSYNISDFATPNVKLITLKHILQTMIFEFNCLVRFTQKPLPVSIKKLAQSLYSAVKSDSIDLNEKFEKLVEDIAPLVPQSDIEYESVFMSTMTNIRSPESVFQSFQAAMKKPLKTMEDHCARLVAFYEFENAAKLNLNESNDIAKFKEYLFYNIIAVKVQEIIPILEDQISRVEGNLAKLSNESKVNQISSYCQSLIFHLNQMIARRKVPLQSYRFTSIFTLFIEFIDLIVKRGIDYHIFMQLIQSVTFPNPDIIKRALADPGEISKLRLLISKIQMCLLGITKTTSIIFDKFTNNKENEETYFKVDQTNGQYINDKKDVFSHQIGLFDRCDEYIRELFVLLDNFKSFSVLFSTYIRFYEYLGQNPSLFKIRQKPSSKISPALMKNIPIFIKSLINMMKVDENHGSFMKLSSPPFDLYATVLMFLKSTYLNEDLDHSALFLHLIESLPIINFSKSLSDFIFNLNRIEVLLLSSNLKGLLKNSLKDYKECTNLIVKSIIVNNSINIQNLNNKIDKFLAGLFYLSPQIYSKVEKYFTSIVIFLKKLDSLKAFISSLSLLAGEYALSTQTFNIQYSDLILRNFVYACVKIVKIIKKSEFVPFEISNYLSGFTLLLLNSLPKRLFEKLDDFQFILILKYLLNLFNSSASFYQSKSFLLPASFITQPPPASFSNHSAEPQQNSHSDSDSSSVLSLQSLSLPSLWLMNNFDFIKQIQPLLMNLTSIVAGADENPENMKILIKMNELVRNLSSSLNPDQIPPKEDEENDFFADSNESKQPPPVKSIRDTYLSKFAFALKLLKLLEKINYESPISQCQFVDCYSSLKALIELEINILHFNRVLMLTNFLFYERINDNFYLVKRFNFTKCSSLDNISKSANSRMTSKSYRGNSKKYSSDDYEEYEESEMDDYDEEQKSNEQPSMPNPKVDNNEEYDEDAEARKEEEEYGEEHDSNEYNESDEAQESQIPQPTSSHTREDSVPTNPVCVFDKSLFEQCIDQNMFKYDFARKVDVDYKFFSGTKSFNAINSMKERKEFNNNDPNSHFGEKEVDGRNDNSSIDENSDNDFVLESVNSFPTFNTTSPSKDFDFFANNGVDNSSLKPPLRAQMQEIKENSESLVNEFRKFIEESGRTINLASRDRPIPFVPLSEAISDLDREIRSVFDKVCQRFKEFESDNAEALNEARELLEDNLKKQRIIDEKQKEFLSKKKEYARSKNVLSYTYSLSVRKYEKIRNENRRKQFELQQLNSRYKLACQLNNLNIESRNDTENPVETRSSDLFIKSSHFDDLIESSDSDDGNFGLNSESAQFHENSMKAALKKPMKGLVVEPFVPVRIVGSVESSSTDIEAVNQALNDALILNERLKGLLKASNEVLNKQRALNQKPNQAKQLASDVENNGKTDVIDRYFGKIALIKSFSENLDNPVSSEVDVDAVGESLINAISEFRKNSTETLQTYREASKELLRKLDKMITIYRIQKDRTNKIRSLIRATKIAKEDYKSALSQLIDDDKF